MKSLPGVTIGTLQVDIKNAGKETDSQLVFVTD